MEKFPKLEHTISYLLTKAQTFSNFLFISLCVQGQKWILSLKKKNIAASALKSCIKWKPPPHPKFFFWILDMNFRLGWINCVFLYWRSERPPCTTSILNDFDYHVTCQNYIFWNCSRGRDFKWHYIIWIGKARKCLEKKEPLPNFWLSKWMPLKLILRMTRTLNLMSF